ncbi:hypothetical protein EZJ58_0955 [Sodalis ligni]|jgi:hypothetical protein|uniref:Uncharacterized protein n=1 Tax=Sodalis ligni TaxID=2697027 RepID=A0A4R1NE66_9GAMM|nr:hypothetical protein EZJ58_0955 [Sodalis ligni]
MIIVIIIIKIIILKHSHNICLFLLPALPSEAAG